MEKGDKFMNGEIATRWWKCVVTADWPGSNDILDTLQT